MPGKGWSITTNVKEQVCTYAFETITSVFVDNFIEDSSKGIEIPMNTRIIEERLGYVYAVFRCLNIIPISIHHIFLNIFGRSIVWTKVPLQGPQPLWFLTFNQHVDIVISISDNKRSDGRTDRFFFLFYRNASKSVRFEHKLAVYLTFAYFSRSFMYILCVSFFLSFCLLCDVHYYNNIWMNEWWNPKKHTKYHKN